MYSVVVVIVIVIVIVIIVIVLIVIVLMLRNSSRSYEMPIKKFPPNSSAMPSTAMAVVEAMAMAGMDIEEVGEDIGEDMVDREE